MGDAVRGFVLQGSVDHLSDAVDLLGTEPAGTQFFMQPVDAQIKETLTPLAHRCAAHSKGFRDSSIAVTSRASLHDLRPLGERMGQGP